MADSHRRIGEAHRRRGDLEAATAAAERARQVHAEVGGPESLASANVRSLLGNLALARGEPGVAWEHFERAAAVYAASVEPDNPDLALARFGMARALAAQSGERTLAARALAEQALNALQAVAAFYPAEVKEVHAWLAGR